MGCCVEGQRGVQCGDKGEVLCWSNPITGEQQPPRVRGRERGRENEWETGERERMNGSDRETSEI